MKRPYKKVRHTEINVKTDKRYNLGKTHETALIKSILFLY